MFLQIRSANQIELVKEPSAVSDPATVEMCAGDNFRALISFRKKVA